MDIKEGPK